MWSLGLKHCCLCCSLGCEVGVVKYAARMPRYLEAVLVLVWGIPCLLHVVRGVCHVTAGMQVRLCMHDACPKPNGILWKLKMEYNNSDLYHRTALSMSLLFTAATAAVLLQMVEKIWYLVSCVC